jgi:uncharacterized protein YbbC (DUF1343 family)
MELDGTTEAQETLGAVPNGIDSLVSEDFASLGEKRVALVATGGSLTLEGKRSIDVLARLDGASLLYVYEPDFSGEINEESVADAATDVPIFPLDGAQRRPDEAQLENVDLVLVDLPDCGSRLTPMITVLGQVLEACAQTGKAVLVLDRPNPLDGYTVEGPCNDAAIESLFSYHPLALRHGMTIGELSRFLNGERGIGANLRIVTTAGWQRAYLFENTGQRWVEPLPGIASQQTALLYPALGLLEQTNVSIGAGTPESLLVLGAPWIDGARLADEVKKAEVPALKVEPLEFTPAAREIYAGQRCAGVRFTIENVQEFSCAALAVTLVKTLRRDYPKQWERAGLEDLLARPDLIEAIEDQAPELDGLWAPDPEFFELRAKYLLYG